jgi:virulence factor Mce-like protein
MARLVAVTTAILFAVTVTALWVTSTPSASGTEVRAEFEDTFPLLPGMHVRVFGAVAGSVKEIELTDRGTAMVTMQLHEGTEPPRRDASAAIRQQDITGDSYVSLELGDDPAELGESVIPTARTLVSPRFDDLMNSFDEPVREGLQLILGEVGMALERRGEDLNDAALELRPALEAANRAVAEVRSQNRTLRDLVADAGAVASQAGRRSRELGELVESLDTTLGTTAAHRGALDEALEVAPETAVEARGVLRGVAAAADAARPVAETLSAAAPDLVTTARLFGPFLEDAGAALDRVRPTMELTERLLRASEPTLEAAPQRVLTAPLDLAAANGKLLNTLIGEPSLTRALFGADAYGQGPSRLDDVGLGALAVERGDQENYEGQDPERRFLRAKPVLSCETFGFEIAPGCLLDVINALGSETSSRASAGAGAPARAGTSAAEREAVAPAQGAAPKAAAPAPRLPDVPRVPGAPSVDDTKTLLDFLFGP